MSARQGASLADGLYRLHQQYRPKGYLLALSGGRDSVVLLHVLHGVMDELAVPVRALHVNHGWHEDARRWAQFCRECCQRFAVPMDVVELNMRDVPGESREAVARDARYRAFAEHLPADWMLLTAHHRDDQAETLLLQLCRGAGLRGLSAMPSCKAFAQGWHGRPLLEVDRAALNQYIADCALHYLDDPSNDDVRYARNYLRHRVLPVLQAGFPAAVKRIAQSAAWMSEAQMMLDEAVDMRLPDSLTDCLHWSPFRECSRAWQRAIIRRWLCRWQVQPPPSQRLDELLRQMQQGHGYAEMVYCDWVLVYEQARLYLYRLTKPAPAPRAGLQVDWSGVGRVEVCDGAALIGQRQYRWSLFPPGSAFRPMGKAHHKPLKFWFHEYCIPRYLRQRTPLFWIDNELAWVGGIGASARFPFLRIDWQNKAHSVTIPTNF